MEAKNSDNPSMELNKLQIRSRISKDSLEDAYTAIKSKVHRAREKQGEKTTTAKDVLEYLEREINGGSNEGLKQLSKVASSEYHDLFDNNSVAASSECEEIILDESELSNIFVVDDIETRNEAIYFHEGKKLHEPICKNAESETRLLYLRKAFPPLTKDEHLYCFFEDSHGRCREVTVVCYCGKVDVEFLSGQEVPCKTHEPYRGYSVGYDITLAKANGTPKEHFERKQEQLSADDQDSKICCVVPAGNPFRIKVKSEHIGAIIRLRVSVHPDTETGQTTNRPRCDSIRGVCDYTTDILLGKFCVEAWRRTVSAAKNRDHHAASSAGSENNGNGSHAASSSTYTSQSSLTHSCAPATSGSHCDGTRASQIGTDKNADKRATSSIIAETETSGHENVASPSSMGHCRVGSSTATCKRSRTLDKSETGNSGNQGEKEAVSEPVRKSSRPSMVDAPPTSRMENSTLETLIRGGRIGCEAYTFLTSFGEEKKNEINALFGDNYVDKDYDVGFREIVLHIMKSSVETSIEAKTAFYIFYDKITQVLSRRGHSVDTTLEEDLEKAVEVATPAELVIGVTFLVRKRGNKKFLSGPLTQALEGDTSKHLRDALSSCYAGLLHQ